MSPKHWPEAESEGAEMSMTVWSVTCEKCGKEAADADRQAFDFKIGDWHYNRSTGKWVCGDCAEKAKVNND